MEIKSIIKRIKWSNIFILIILILSIIKLSTSIIKYYRWNIENNDIIKEIDNIDKVTDNRITIDFNKLLEINSNTKAWIKVNNSNIDYPVVQYKNNNYYLNHSFENKESSSGWIFFDYRNNLDNSDDLDNLDSNTIIYGHARKNNSMFGSLKNILNEEWYLNKTNHLIYLTTSNYNTIWEVFSTYTVNVEDYYLTVKFEDNLAFISFIDTIISRSIYNYGKSVNENDKVLTLSTCYNKHKRIVLHAKLVKKEEK